MTETWTEIAKEYDDGRPNPIADAAYEAGMNALTLGAPGEDAGLVVISVIDWLCAEKFRRELPEIEQR